MAKKRKKLQHSKKRHKEVPGLSLELIVARIQQMMDPNSKVTHNELLEDRAGNKRQYDVVIRGQFGGREILGVIECKDHSRKKGPDAVEAFAKKTENLRVNLRLMVSKKGFTKQALTLAKHEGIGCLSLLPTDSDQVGFTIGDMWYGVVRKWTNMRLSARFAQPVPLGANPNLVHWNGKPVGNWFIRELLTTHGDEKREGDHVLNWVFEGQQNFDFDGVEHAVFELGCIATRVCQKKRKWVSWTGDAFYDWHMSRVIVAPEGNVIGGPVEFDLGLWPDYEGEIPDENLAPGVMRLIMIAGQQWDASKDVDVPDLGSLQPLIRYRL